MPTARRPRPAPITEIDDKLLEQLRLHRVLTTAQAADTTGLAVRTASRRLLNLRRAGLVDRFQPGACNGTRPFHWWLTTAGHIRRESSTRVSKDGLPVGVLEHAAATAAVPIALAKLGPPLHLRRWTRDFNAWHKWHSADQWRHLTPDGLALLRIDGYDAPLPVLVEVDRGKMDHRKLRPKFETYLWYATDRAWRERHRQCPVLLFLTTSPERADNTFADIEQVKNKHGLFSSATAELVIAVAATVKLPNASVTEPVWRTSLDGPALTLTELLRVCLDDRARNPVGWPA